jgi:SAM-dependent methyltransferase
MRKDYIEVSQSTTNGSEIDRVEQYWTSIWQQSRESFEARASKVVEREEYQLMRPYLNRLKLPARLLDAGCGLGDWTIYLSGQGFETYGIDISRETITLLTKQFPQLHFSCGDIRRLEFADNFFDAYFSWGVFEHFEEGLGNCICEAWRVLQPDGFLFISVPFQNWRHIWRDSRPLKRWDAGYDTDRGFGHPMHFYQWRLTMPELEQELAIRGFKVIQIQPIAMESGLQRALHHDFHLSQESRGNIILRRLLRRISPRRWFSHMLMAVAQKKS